MNHNLHNAKIAQPTAGGIPVPQPIQANNVQNDKIK
jgi:hypothetical protein